MVRARPPAEPQSVRLAAASVPAGRLSCRRLLAAAVPFAFPAAELEPSDAAAAMPGTGPAPTGWTGYTTIRSRVGPGRFGKASARQTPYGPGVASVSVARTRAHAYGPSMVAQIAGGLLPPAKTTTTMATKTKRSAAKSGGRGSQMKGRSKRGKPAAKATRSRAAKGPKSRRMSGRKPAGKMSGSRRKAASRELAEVGT